MSKKCSVQAESKPCDRSSFATCDGCHQPFCLPHLSAHQQELATQMERIVSDHDLLCEELNQYRIHPQDEMPDFGHEFNLIDAWQTRALTQVTEMITQEADRARNVVHLVMNENQRRLTSNMVAVSEEFERLKKRLVALSEQLQKRMKASDYLEPDLRQWQDQLRDIRKASEAPQVQTRVIANKLVVKETKEFQVNVSNALDIQYEDAEKNKPGRNSFGNDCEEELFVQDDQREHSPVNTSQPQYPLSNMFCSQYSSPTQNTSQRHNPEQSLQNSGTNTYQPQYSSLIRNTFQRPNSARSSQNSTTNMYQPQYSSLIRNTFQRPNSARSSQNSTTNMYQPQYSSPTQNTSQRHNPEQSSQNSTTNMYQPQYSSPTQNTSQRHNPEQSSQNSTTNMYQPQYSSPTQNTSQRPNPEQSSQNSGTNTLAVASFKGRDNARKSRQNKKS